MKMKLLIFLGTLTIVIGGFYLWNIINNENNTTKGHELEQSVIDYLNELDYDWEFKEETNTLYVKFYDPFFENDDKTKNTLLKCKERFIEEIVKRGGRDDTNVSFVINDKLYNFE